MYYSRPFKQDPSSRGDYTPDYNDSPPHHNSRNRQQHNSSDWYPQQQHHQQHGLAQGSRQPSQAHPEGGAQQQESITGMLNNFSKALGKFTFSLL